MAVNTPGEMDATALHWAGYNGNRERNEVILLGSGQGGRRNADHVGTVRALLGAGKLEPSAEVLELLR